MNRCYRFILNFTITVALGCFFLIPPAYSSPIVNTQITAKDFFKLGVDKMLSGNYQAAIKDFTEAIEHENSFSAAYSNRCLAYLQLEDYQNAISDCTQAIVNSSDNVEAYLNRGLAYYRQGNYEAAIADNNQAIALKPYDFRAYYNRGVARAMVGEYREAIADYNQALSQSFQYSLPLMADIYNDRGLARFELADLPAAMRDFSLAIRINANNYRAYFNRGCTCGKRGDHSSAVRDFSESLRLNPSNAQAYLNRGIAQHQLGYHEAAIADLQQAAKYFGYQQQKVAYEKTLDLIKTVQQQMPSVAEIALRS